MCASVWSGNQALAQLKALWPLKLLGVWWSIITSNLPKAWTWVRNWTKDNLHTVLLNEQISLCKIYFTQLFSLCISVLAKHSGMGLNRMFKLYNTPICFRSKYHLMQCVLFFNISFCSFSLRVPIILEGSAAVAWIKEVAALKHGLIEMK